MAFPEMIHFDERAIRKHWGIENEAHWTLDCTFSEDACRIRSFHSPRDFALLRRIALIGSMYGTGRMNNKKYVNID